MKLLNSKKSFHLILTNMLWVNRKFITMLKRRGLWSMDSMYTPSDSNSIFDYPYSFGYIIPINCSSI